MHEQMLFLYNIFMIFIVAFASLYNCEIIAKTSSSETYSIQFRSSTDQNVGYEVFVSGVSVASGSQVYPNSGWIDFNVLSDEVISVKITTFPTDPYALYYVVHNGPGGGGSEIYDSRSTTFFPVNTCESGSCEVALFNNNFGSSTGNVYVNDQLIVENFTGGTENYFTINSGDSIRIVFTYAGGDTQIVYFIQIRGSDPNFWFYNAYGTNSLIHGSTINPNRPPFGGQYYPITSEQVSSFANIIGGGKQNSVWIPLTLPIN
jgi:hypothetical protein